jgi:predicted membrane protein
MNEWEKDPEKARDAFVANLKSKIENRARHHWHDSFQQGIIWGAVICAIGVILLLDHMGIVSADRLWRFWPLLIIFAGVVNLVSQAGRRAWGGLLIVVGTLFQLDSLGMIRFHWGDLWPLAIIAAGVMMIWGSIESRKVRDKVRDSVSAAGGDPSTVNAMNATAVFGGIERRISVRDFRGGRVSAVFGGIELDFRDADIDGNEAVLEVNAIFGGAEIRVPDNWKVEQRGQTLFGGYTDTTRLSAAAADANAPSKKTLLITGSILFGGVEVTN